MERSSPDESSRHLQQWLRSLSASFIRLPANEINSALEDGLRQIVDFLEVDRSTLFEFSPDGSSLIAAKSWARAGFEEFRSPLLRQQLPWYHQQLASGRTVVLENLPYDLPEEAVEEREYVAASGLRSNLTIPVVVAGSPACALAVGSFRSQRHWTTDTIDQLSLAAEILAAALQRSKDHRELIGARNLAQHFFDSLDSAAAVLDAGGTICGMNRAWQQSGTRGGAEPVATVGDNYLACCEQARWPGGDRSEDTVAGITSVLEHRAPEFLLQYRPETDPGDRTFLLRVLPLQSPAGGAIVMHIDISDRLRAERQLENSLTEISRLKGLLEEENLYLQEEIRADHDFGNIVGDSVPMRAVLSRVEPVAKTDATVLILGETGTGKELLAHAIHDCSTRSERALIKVNCASLPSSLIESELFGHEKGAFTGAIATKKGRFELADGGTLFLDEIGDLDLELQAKLLRVLQSGEFERVGSTRTIRVDVRIIAATHRDLERNVARKVFREDLFHRLNVFPLKVPPLRERTEDIPLLVWHFLSWCERQWGRRLDVVPATVMDALRSYSWPGNVRELKNVVERAVILSDGNQLRLDPGSLGSVGVRSGGHQEDNLNALQRSHIRRVLKDCGWRINGSGNAAERLGIHPNTLRHRMKKLRISRPG